MRWTRLVVLVAVAACALLGGAGAQRQHARPPALSDILKFVGGMTSAPQPKSVATPVAPAPTEAELKAGRMAGLHRMLQQIQQLTGSAGNSTDGGGSKLPPLPSPPPLPPLPDPRDVPLPPLPDVSQLPVLRLPALGNATAPTLPGTNVTLPQMPPLAGSGAGGGLSPASIISGIQGLLSALPGPK